MPDFSAAGLRMWQLVERYTGRVGYGRGTKAAGLDALPPVIDCSGWVGVRLMPIDQWLAAFNTHIAGGNAWAVDPFAMANRRGGT
jgi:hypothetical protein